MSGAVYYGYNRMDYVTIDRKMLERGQGFSLKKSIWGDDLHQQSVTFDPEDLRILLNAKLRKETKRHLGVSGELELLRLRMHKVLPDENGAAVGDVDLRIVYKP